MTVITKIGILDPEEETSDQKNIDVIHGSTGKTNTTKILSKRKTPRGPLSIFVLVLSSEAALFVSSKLRIGYVNCRVGKAVEFIRYFRCQNYGHTKSNCNDPEPSSFCWSHGEEGHKSSEEVKKPPKCLLCKNEVSNDHLQVATSITRYVVPVRWLHNDKTMINCLQINLYCCKTAQALLHQTAAQGSVDFIFVSELN